MKTEIKKDKTSNLFLLFIDDVLFWLSPKRTILEEMIKDELFGAL